MLLKLRQVVSVVGMAPKNVAKPEPVVPAATKTSKKKAKAAPALTTASSASLPATSSSGSNASLPSNTAPNAAESVSTPTSIQARYTTEFLPALYAVFAASKWPFTLVHELQPGAVMPPGWEQRTLRHILQDIINTIEPGTTYRIEINHELYKKVSHHILVLYARFSQFDRLATVLTRSVRSLRPPLWP
jgi:hypothetical protein